MKQIIKRTARRLGAHLYTDGSLPTGHDWLHDIRRLRVLGPRPTCLDVGANVGQTVMQIRGEWPEAVIHAFEPFAEPFTALQAAVAGQSGVSAVRLALAAQPGVISVAPRAQSVLNSLRQHAADEPPAALAEVIAIETVDRWCSRQRIDSVDILKTDTEGGDLEVLQGADTMLREQRIGFVYAEVTFLPANRQNTPFQPLHDWVTGHDYRFLGLYETWSMHHFAEPNVFCNALFVSRRRWQQGRED